VEGELYLMNQKGRKRFTARAASPFKSAK